MINFNIGHYVAALTLGRAVQTEGLRNLKVEFRRIPRSFGCAKASFGLNSIFTSQIAHWASA